MDERSNGLVSKRESQRAHTTGSARGVLRRASDFAPPHFGTQVFPREFVGCSVPVLSVSFLKPVLQNHGFPRVFRISGQLFGSSVAPMQLGAWRLRRCISRRAPKIESFFESRESPKHWGFACHGLATIHARGGGRIRTII